MFLAKKTDSIEIIKLTDLTVYQLPCSSNFTSVMYSLGSYDGSIKSLSRITEKSVLCLLIQSLLKFLLSCYDISSKLFMVLGVLGFFRVFYFYCFYGFLLFLMAFNFLMVFGVYPVSFSFLLIFLRI